MTLRGPALLLLVACTPLAPENEPAPRAEAVVVAHEAAPPTATPSRTGVEMADHYRDAVQIKNAVIDGDLRAVQAPARRLVDDAGHYPEPWRPYVAMNANYAAALLAARDRHAAGVAAAGLARTCGDCHGALGVGPAFEPPHDLPTASPHDVLRHMHRHQWAADRMWEALIDRSEYAWMAGAAALVDAPLPRADLTQDVELPEDVLELGGKIHKIGALAGSTVGWDARAGLYGEFLATCAGCHQGGC
jgi:cytochrome c553